MCVYIAQDRKLCVCVCVHCLGERSVCVYVFIAYDKGLCASVCVLLRIEVCVCTCVSVCVQCLRQRSVCECVCPLLRIESVCVSIA